jgi:hypothetical protein
VSDRRGAGDKHTLPFFWAYAPQSMKTTCSQCLLMWLRRVRSDKGGVVVKNLMMASVKCSQPCDACELGSFTRTVRTWWCDEGPRTGLI